MTKKHEMKKKEERRYEDEIIGNVDGASNKC